MRSCATCIFFCPNELIPVNRDKLPEGFGECRRRAPFGMSATFYSNPGDAENYTRILSFRYPFPTIPPQDWCGEWQPSGSLMREDGGGDA